MLPSAADAHACSIATPVVVAMEKEVEVEADLDENGGDEDPVDDTRPSASLPSKAQRREGDGSGASGASGPQAAEAAAGADAVGEDDYQAYYLSAASEEGG